MSVLLSKTDNSNYCQLITGQASDLVEAVIINDRPLSALIEQVVSKFDSGNGWLVILEPGVEVNPLGWERLKCVYQNDNDLTVFETSDRWQGNSLSTRVVIVRVTDATRDLVARYDGTSGSLNQLVRQIPGCKRLPGDEISRFFSHSLREHPFIDNGNLGPESQLEFAPYLNGQLIYRFMYTGYTKSPPLLDLLSQVTIPENRKIEIHCCFMNNFTPEQRQPDTVYIIYHYENQDRFPITSEHYDFAVSLNVTCDTVSPTAVSPIHREISQKLVGLSYDVEYLRALIRRKTKFCCFIVSNACCGLRNRFFQYVSRRYKRVDSLGQYRNNVGYLLPHRDSPEYDEAEFLEMLSEYKFMICFENSKREGYVTEKLVNALAGRTVPIYWGAPDVNRLVNPDAFINIDDYGCNFGQVLERIRQLDNDDAEYLRVLSQPAVINPYLTETDFDRDWSRKLQRIVDQKIHI